MDVEDKKSKEIQEETDDEKESQDIFSIKEVTVEEMAIDGICGVY